MSRTKYRFESELHLGLLVIVLVLLALNLVSNFVVFRARVRMHEIGLAAVSTAALESGRQPSADLVKAARAEGIAERMSGQRRISIRA